MDAAMTGGLVVTVIGVGTVFTALLCLSGFVFLIDRLGPSARSQSGAAPAREANPAPERVAEPEEAEEETDLRLVALAAYALHRRHRFEPGDAPAATPWVQAGRVRGMASFRR